MHLSEDKTKLSSKKQIKTNLALNLSEGYNESRRMNQEESTEEHSNKSGPEAHLWPSTECFILKEENRYSPTYKSAGEVLT